MTFQPTISLYPIPRQPRPRRRSADVAGCAQRGLYIRPSYSTEVSCLSAVVRRMNPPSKIQDCSPTSPEPGSSGYPRGARQSVPETGSGDIINTWTMVTREKRDLHRRCCMVRQGRSPRQPHRGRIRHLRRGPDWSNEGSEQGSQQLSLASP